MPESYAFCERIDHAGRWHIRALVTGLRLDAVADTEALCGEKNLWDLNIRPSQVNLQNIGCCPECTRLYEKTAEDAPVLQRATPLIVPLAVENGPDIDLALETYCPECQGYIRPCDPCGGTGLVATPAGAQIQAFVLAKRPSAPVY